MDRISKIYYYSNLRKMELKTKVRQPKQKSLSRNAFIRLAVLESKMKRKQTTIALSTDINNISNWELEENQIQLFVQRAVLFARKTQPSTLLAQCLYKFISLLAPFGIKYRIGILYQMTRIQKTIDPVELQKCLAENLELMDPKFNDIESVQLDCLLQFCKLTQNQLDFQVVLLKCIQKLEKIAQNLFQNVQISQKTLQYCQSSVSLFRQNQKLMFQLSKFCCLGMIKSMRNSTRNLYAQKLIKFLQLFFQSGKKYQSAWVQRIKNQVENQRGMSIWGSKLRYLILNKQQCRFLRWKGYPTIAPINFQFRNKNCGKQNIFRSKKIQNIKESSFVQSHYNKNTIQIKKQPKLDVKSRIYSLSFDQIKFRNTLNSHIATKLSSSCPFSTQQKKQSESCHLKMSELLTEIEQISQSNSDSNISYIKQQKEDVKNIDKNNNKDQAEVDIVKFQSSIEQVENIQIKETLDKNCILSTDLKQQQIIAVQLNKKQEDISEIKHKKQQKTESQMESECWELLTDHITDLVQQWMEAEVQNVSQKHSLELEQIYEPDFSESQQNQQIQQQNQLVKDPIIEIMSMSEFKSSVCHEQPVINIKMISSSKSNEIQFEDEQTLEPCQSQITQNTEFKQLGTKLGQLTEIDLNGFKIRFYLKFIKNTTNSQIIAKNIDEVTVLKIPILPQQKLSHVLSRIKDTNNYKTLNDNIQKNFKETDQLDKLQQKLIVKQTWVQLWTSYIKIECNKIRKNIKAKIFVKWHTDQTFNLLMMIMSNANLEIAKYKATSVKDCVIQKQRYLLKKNQKMKILGSIKVNNLDGRLWPNIRDGVELIIGANVKLDLSGRITIQNNPIIQDIIKLIV